MGRYFKIIGSIELVGWFIGLIPFFIYFVPLIRLAASQPEAGGVLVFLYILAIAAYVFFGPALGLAFFCLGILWDKSPDSYRPGAVYYRKTYNSSTSVDSINKERQINVVTTQKSKPEKQGLTLGKAVRLKETIQTSDGVIIRAGTYGSVYDDYDSPNPVISFTISGRTVKTKVSIDVLDY